MTYEEAVSWLDEVDGRTMVLREADGREYVVVLSAKGWRRAEVILRGGSGVPVTRESAVQEAFARACTALRDEIASREPTP